MGFIKQVIPNICPFPETIRAKHSLQTQTNGKSILSAELTVATMNIRALQFFTMGKLVISVTESTFHILSLTSLKVIREL